MSGQNSATLLASDLRQDDLWATKVGFYMLWFEYLALSPSYELARLHSRNKLNDKQRTQLPKDFDQVCRVFDDFGDVQRKLFLPWWRERGMRLCGYQGEKPMVTKVAAVSRQRHDPATLAGQVASFVDSHWNAQGEQNTLLVAIPIGLPMSRIEKEVREIVGKCSKQEREIRPPEALYSLAGKRQNKDMLFRYRHVLLGRAAMPNAELWRVGVRTGVSDTYSPELDYNAKVVRNEDTYDRMMLTILTSRAFQRGRLIAENAARGIFPSYSKCEHAVEFDLNQLYKRFAARRRWMKNQ